MPYKKYDPKVDSLEEGTKIRLAGYETFLLSANGSQITFKLPDGKGVTLKPGAFPDLEIFVQPLTIPQRTKKIVLEKYLDPKINYETFRSFLESLEVTND